MNSALLANFKACALYHASTMIQIIFWYWWRNSPLLASLLWSFRIVCCRQSIKGCTLRFHILLLYWNQNNRYISLSIYGWVVAVSQCPQELSGSTIATFVLMPARKNDILGPIREWKDSNFVEVLELFDSCYNCSHLPCPSLEQPAVQTQNITFFIRKLPSWTVALLRW